MKYIVALLLAFTLTFSFNTAYSQCAMCRSTVESNVGTGSGNNAPESEVGKGLNTGILYLMVIPYILIGTLGFLWYQSNRKKKHAGAV
jgi:hypothetical protein